MSQQTTPQPSQSANLQDHSQPRRSFFANVWASSKLFRFWWTQLGVFGVLLGFSLIWVGALGGFSWPASGWAVALGPWSYDTINFPGALPVLFLTLWLVPLTAVLLLGTNIAHMGGRSIFWASIWAWLCLALSLVVLVTVIVAGQGHCHPFPFLVTITSLIVAGLGIFARHPDEWVNLVAAQPHFSRRRLLFHLAGMAGLVAIGGGVGAWLVDQSRRTSASRLVYALPQPADGFSHYYHAFAWTPQNSFVMAQYQDQTIEDNPPLDVWEIAPTTRHIGTQGSEFFYGDVVFAPNGHWLMVACFGNSYDTTSFIWDLQTGATTPIGLDSPTISWSPDSSRLVGQDEETLRGVVIWDVSHNRKITSYQVPESDGLPWNVAWSPDGRWIAVQEFPYVTTFRLYDVRTGRLVWLRTFEPHIQTLDGTGAHVAHFAWSPDSRYLALPLTSTAFIDDPVTMYPVIIWDVVEQREMLSYTGHPGGADSVAWSPDGQYVASGGMYDATVQIWHARTGNVVFTFREHQKPVSYIGWSPDGTTIASVDVDQVLIWDAPTR